LFQSQTLFLKYLDEITILVSKYMHVEVAYGLSIAAKIGYLNDLKRCNGHHFASFRQIRMANYVKVVD